ncbi:MAG: hypothetical protein IT258_24105 [Saprospiraceae bacterium]|nr:hypothetical protein [Saprospiraceae bacterium]
MLKNTSFFIIVINAFACINLFAQPVSTFSIGFGNTIFTAKNASYTEKIHKVYGDASVYYPSLEDIKCNSISLAYAYKFTNPQFGLDFHLAGLRKDILIDHSYDDWEIFYTTPIVAEFHHQWELKAILASAHAKYDLIGYKKCGLNIGLGPAYEISKLVYNSNTVLFSDDYDNLSFYEVATTTQEVVKLGYSVSIDMNIHLYKAFAIQLLFENARFKNHIYTTVNIGLGYVFKAKNQS